MRTNQTSLVLSSRALNRATFARQFLAEPSHLPALEVICHLICMQSQAPDPPYIGLWTRMASFHAGELERLLTDREVVRIALMRSTIHLVTAADCLPLRAAVQPMLDRGLQSNYGRLLEGLDRRQLELLTRRLLDDGPRTLNDIGRQLEYHLPGRDVKALGVAARDIRASRASTATRLVACGWTL